MTLSLSQARSLLPGRAARLVEHVEEVAGDRYGPPHDVHYDGRGEDGDGLAVAMVMVVV